MAGAPLFAVLGALLTGRVIAQTASVTAVCTYAEWTFYKGQSPCQIWGNLQAACNPGVSVGKLDTSVNIDATYPSPSGANATACQCNVVAYNLMAGCSWCQPNVYSTNWVSELQWKSGCSSYDPSGQLPSQASVLSSSIPPWALEQENGNSWEEFDASSIAVAGTTPTPTLDGGFGTLTSFGSGPTFTGPHSGGDDGGDGFDNIDNNTGKAVGKTVGIAVGVVGGIWLIVYSVVLVIFCTRQKNRKAWYGPTAQFYMNGGRMPVGDMQATQPLLGNATVSSSNPFGSPSPSATSGAVQSLSSHPSYPSTTPPVQYDPNANHGLDYPAAPYQQPPTGQYDTSLISGHPYPQYYDPNTPQTGSTPQIAQV